MEAYPDNRNLFRNLNNTFARWDGRACAVTVPEDGDQINIIVRGEKKSQRVKYTDPRFDITGLSIGYANQTHGPVFVYRRCMRQWTEAIPIHTLSSIGPLNIRSFSLNVGEEGYRNMQAMLESIDNIYPTKEEAFKNEQAFHKFFSFYRGNLYHRGVAIGAALAPDKVRLEPGTNKRMYKILLDKHGIQYD